jgi:MFS superfamily sulfate permease-like transporter
LIALRTSRVSLADIRAGFLVFLIALPPCLGIAMSPSVLHGMLTAIGVIVMGKQASCPS